MSERINKTQLMESVRVRRYIYDYNEKNYRDKELKYLAWEEIATECGAKNGKAAQKEWKKLRDNFRDAVKRYNNSKKGKTLEHYVYYKQMGFIRPFITGKFQLDNQDQEKCSDTVEDNDFQCWSPEVSLSSHSIDRNEEEVKINILEEPAHKKIILDPLSDSLRIEDKQDNNFSTEISNHSVDIFFKAMSETTKKMPEKYQLLIKKKLFNLVHEYECEILENSSKNNV